MAFYMAHTLPFVAGKLKRSTSSIEDFAAVVDSFIPKEIGSHMIL